MKDMKKAIIFIVFAIVVSACLFASDDGRFRLKHVINTEDECRVEFWQIGTTNSFPSNQTEITSTAPTRFATIGVHYSGTNKYKITIGNTPLYLFTTNENSEKVFNLSYTYPYTLEALESGSNTILGQPEEAEGTITVGSINTPYSYIVISDDSGLSSSRLHSGTYSLADLRITLGSDDNSPAGNYQGYLVCWVETI